MNTKSICLISLVFVLFLNTVTLAVDFADDFGTSHDYLTEGVSGTIWDGFIGLDLGETVDILDASVTQAGELYMASTDGYWLGSGNTLAPFLYKIVDGDFVATVKVTGYQNIMHNSCGIMARAPRKPEDLAGAGEDWVSMDYFPIYNCGNFARKADDDVRQELCHNGMMFDLDPYIQLERVGNTFHFRHSPDGVSWTEMSCSPLIRSDLDSLYLQVGLMQATFSANQGYATFDDFSLVLPDDESAPNPNPATFASEPHALSDTVITMVATTGFDMSAPVEYYFDEVSGNSGGSDSGWITNPEYTDSGLTLSTQYAYTVTMRDSIGNIGIASAAHNATTFSEPDIIPPSPDPAQFATAPTAISSTEIYMSVVSGTDISNPVEYYFDEVSGRVGGTDSGWITTSEYTDSELDPQTQYTYTVTMRDSLGNTGNASAQASATTKSALIGPISEVFDVKDSYEGSDSVVVFNEIMYHPTTAEEDFEWIELYNQMKIDIDLSRWSLSDGVRYIFPEGTIIHGGECLLVVGFNPSDPDKLDNFINEYGTDPLEAREDIVGPWIGQLSNGGEKIILKNNNKRIMDVVDYDTSSPWPIGSDGSGASLAKIDKLTASQPYENWAVSSQVGGTPSQVNYFDNNAAIVFNEVSSVQQYPFWLELYNYGSTSVNLENFVIRSSSGNEFVFGVQSFNAGNYLVVDATSLGFSVSAGDKLFLYNPSRTALIDTVVLTEKNMGKVLDDLAGPMLYPDSATPGADNSFEFRDEIVINEIMYNHSIEYATPSTAETYTTETLVNFNHEWKYEQSGTDLGTGWRETSYNDASWSSGAGLLYVEGSDLPEPKNTPLTIGPKTFYFRSHFNFDENPNTAVASLKIRTIVDDGVVIYLNGSLLFRLGVPEGQTYDTLANRTIDNANYEGYFTIPSDALLQGDNVLAAEVHQVTTGSSDIVFGIEIVANQIDTPAIPGDPAYEVDEEWIELYNSSIYPVDVSRWKLADAVEYTFPDLTIIEPDEYIVIAKDRLAMKRKYPDITVLGNYSRSLSNKSDRIILLDDTGNPADVVKYYDDKPWSPYADSGGTSLELRNPFADNTKPEAWDSSDESIHSQWKHYSFTDTALLSIYNPYVDFHELRLGTHFESEILLDNISIIEDPQGTAREIIQNSSFSTGADKWRFLGNHSHSLIIDDVDNPGNKVLKLVATGPTNYLSNRVETTFKYGDDFVPVLTGTQYQISFDAKWLAGSPQLHTEFYYNKIARTVILDMPEKHGTPGTQNSTYEENIGPTYKDLTHSPAVPDPGQAITVSVTAEDTDGVNTMTIRYSVEGGTWLSASMAAGDDGLYTGSIPGQSAGQVIQFYVDGADDLGVHSLYPAKGPDSRALIQVQDGLANSAKQNFRIIMTTADAAILHERLNITSNDLIGVTVVYNESDLFYDCGVRLRGSVWTRDAPTVAGLYVRFPADNLFRDIHKSVSIKVGTTWDQSRFIVKEIFSTHVINQVGNLPGHYGDIIHLIASKSNNVGRAFMMMSRFNDIMLDSQFDDGADGTTFKLEGVKVITRTDPEGDPEGLKKPKDGIGSVDTDVTDHAGNKEQYRWNLKIGNNRAVDDYSALMTMAKGWDLTGDDLLQSTSETMDVDLCMRQFALQSLLCVNDLYPNPAHNLMLYVRPSDGKIMSLPWDWDQVFSPIRSATQSLWDSSSKNITKIIELPPYTRLLYGHFHDMINTTCNADYMAYWVSHFSDVIDQDYSSFLTKIGDRATYVLSQLPGEIPFAITTTSGITVGDEWVTIEGQGWINVKKIRLAGNGTPLNVTWLETGSGWADTFHAIVPLEYGTNNLVLEAYDYQDELITTDNITITTTAHPLKDDIRITEIMYHPLNPNNEFIEIKNIGTQTRNLADVKFTNGIDFTFPNINLQPGQHTVVIKEQVGAVGDLNQDGKIDSQDLWYFATQWLDQVGCSGDDCADLDYIGGVNLRDFALLANNWQNDDTLFESEYGTSINIAGQYVGSLDNSGERIRLEDAIGRTIHDFDYKDGWYNLTDGDGFSLNIIDANNIDPDSWDEKDAWRSSTYMNGSPGSGDTDILPLPGSIVINELMSHTDFFPNDWIELHNTTGLPIDIGGFFLSDDADNLTKYQIAAGTTILANDFIVFDEDTNFGLLSTDLGVNVPFAFSENGETAYLSSWLDTYGNPTGYRNAEDFGPSENNVAFGRYFKSTGTLNFVAMSENTPGLPNAYPKIGPVVISEIMYHPEFDDDAEFIELYNITDSIVNLYDVNTISWKITEGIEFTFPPITTIDPCSVLLLVKNLDSFNAAYPDAPAWVQKFQWTDGSVNNGGEKLEISKPGDVNDNGILQYIRIDRVSYSDGSNPQDFNGIVDPWPSQPDGLGSSLEKIHLDLYGNDPNNWDANQPSPGLIPTMPLDWTILTYDDFESGWGNYTSGGGDALIYDAVTYSHQGTNAADIQDDSGDASAFYHTNPIDIYTDAYTQIKVNFWFYAVNMDPGENFQLLYYDGSSWQTVETFTASTDFENNNFYFEQIIIDSSSYNFPTNMKLKFQCNASSNTDDIYIDQIAIWAK